MSAPTFQIAHILPWPTIGGTEHATLRIAQTMEGEKFRSIAFCAENSPVREMFNAAGFATVSYTGVEPSYRHVLSYFQSSLRLARDFRLHQIDLLHCSDLLGAYYAGLAGKLAGLPVLCHVRCSYPDISRRDRSFLWPVDRFSFVSRSTWDTFGYRVPAHRGTVIYDGIDLVDSANQNEAYSSVRREFGIPAATRIVGMVSRVAPAKDYPTLIDAAVNVVARQPDVRFLIVGDHSQVALNREHYLEIKQLVSARGMEPYFVFTDHRDDVTRLTSAMDVFVLSTHTEGLPLVILEAMALGKPVIGTDVGGVSEVIEHRHNGLLSPHQDAKTLADQIVSLLQDENLTKALADAGRETVKTRFSRASCYAQLEKLYREVLGDREPKERSATAKDPLTNVGGFNS